MSLFLGIDTSAYTTSIAVINERQHILKDHRILLQVNKGERGLRQSEAVFSHLKNLPLLFEQIPSIAECKFDAMAVSAFPRRVKGSYMPVFIAGLSQVKGLSAFSGIPFYEVSHQEGHIMAGLAGNQQLINSRKFLAVHFSGGTSEILLAKRVVPGFIKVNSCISSLDLHAGQLVDRIGVAIGLPFPSGRALEELALKADMRNLRIPSFFSEKGFSFSGAETRALSMLKKGEPPEEIAFAVLRVIANTLEKAILEAADRKDVNQVLLVGGVMANSIIRSRLAERLEHKAAGLKLYFAEPRLSSDNAVGVAMLAQIINQQHSDHMATYPDD